MTALPALILLSMTLYVLAVWLYLHPAIMYWCDGFESSVR